MTVNNEKQRHQSLVGSDKSHSHCAEHLDIQTVITPGKTGQFDVIADGERIAERAGSWFA